MDIDQKNTGQPKLFMVLLGSKAENRNVEQHDFFFGVGRTLAELVPALEAFWPEAGKSLHIDGWREVTAVDGFRVEVYRKQETEVPAGHRLFFINLELLPLSRDLYVADLKCNFKFDLYETQSI